MNRSIAAGAVLAATAVAGIGIAAAAAVAPQQGAPSPVWVAMPPVGSMDGMNITSEAEYLADMVAHHQEAVAAAKQLQRSERPQMRALGSSIVTTQTAEIATMKTWLATWYRGQAPASGYRPMMRDLTHLSGDALNRTFLQDMIPHHMMAVMMSQHLLMRGGIQHEQVTAFAVKVRDAQHAEMMRMQGYLADWFGESGMSCPMWGEGRPGMRSERPGQMMGW